MRAVVLSCGLGGQTIRLMRRNALVGENPETASGQNSSEQTEQEAVLRQIEFDAKAEAQQRQVANRYQPGHLRAFLQIIRREVDGDADLVKQSLADLNAMDWQNLQTHSEARREYIKQVAELDRVAQQGIREYGLVVPAQRRSDCDHLGVSGRGIWSSRRTTGHFESAAQGSLAVRNRMRASRSRGGGRVLQFLLHGGVASITRSATQLPFADSENLANSEISTPGRITRSFP
jgi:hypothetical protein